MRISRFPIVALVIGLVAGAAGDATADDVAPPLSWRPWTADVFAAAKREHKLVLLDLEAVWCHWCHVMDETTYQAPAVVAALGRRYILVRVDQDSRPDLASRYEDYGWPATVVFSADGAEVVKRRGYIPPTEMAELLRGLPDHAEAAATPEMPLEIASDTQLSAERRALVLRRWRGFYDEEKGGWGFGHKYLDWDSVELALRLAVRGDAVAGRMARTTLRLQRENLLDPVWGGVYQYSVGGDWREPHFEKLIQFQAENIRTYAVAFAQGEDPSDLEAAKAIHRYVRSFLTGPAGTVFVSQDADLVPGVPSADFFALGDAARRARGVPAVDAHVYARENGWYILALCKLSAVSGDPTYRDEAVRAAEWIIDHRGLPGGGFRHGEADLAGPFLGDTLSMARAFLGLYQITQQRRWVDRAEAAARYIARHFRTSSSGFSASEVPPSSSLPPANSFDENVALVRFSVALATATGAAEDRELGRHALRWLLSESVLDERGPYVAGLLLAEEEFRTDPLHIAIVGPRTDATAAELFRTALRVPTTHKFVEWWDPREPAPVGQPGYPVLSRSAAFLCANGACSPPIFSGAVLRKRVARALELGGTDGAAAVPSAFGPDLAGSLR